ILTQMIVRVHLVLDEEDTSQCGGIHALIESGSTFTIADSSQIRNCSSIRTTGNTGDGGGIYAIVGENCQLIISNTVQIEDCKSGRRGGGAYIRNIAGNGRVEMNQINVKLCYGTEGGGIYTQIERQSNFTITGTSVFENCHSTGGNGGALYASVIGQNSKLIIKDDVRFALIQRPPPCFSALHSPNRLPIISRSKLVCASIQAPPP
ncbi:MAG: hypothetical protein EZS28_054011, partial [Streblomastix strix]